MSEEATQDVVKSTDVAKKTPTSFRDLDKPQLVAAAQAFGTQDEGTVTELRTDLVENGVTWEMYAREFKLEGYENAPAAEPVEPRQVDVENAPDKEVSENVTQEVVVATPQTFQSSEKYLIKFIGQNPYFEFGKYRFTQDKPYGIMNAADAQSALVNEPTKFRQAFPAELQEFYG